MDAATVNTPSRDELQARIRQMQATTLGEKSQPVLPGLEGLLPEGLRPGSTYSVTGSTTLALALLAGPSQQGAWCGALGLPELGTEAAARFGIDLARLVLVPRPERQWLTVAAAMVEVLGVVIAAPPPRIAPGEAARLSARLRGRSSSLIVLGDWPGAEGRLRVTDSRWAGLGSGHGHLGGRSLTVEATGRSGRSRLRQVEIPTTGLPRLGAPELARGAAPLRALDAPEPHEMTG